MTITMYCDRCGEKVNPGINGGVRTRLGAKDKELSFHLCAAHQDELLQMVVDFCKKHAPREVGATLKL